MGAFIFLVVLLGIFSQVHGIVIPGPDSDHKYKSAVAEISLTDPNRKDPWNMTENRKTMVSVFIPPIHEQRSRKDRQRPVLPR
jgi:hypothetical protein